MGKPIEIKLDLPGVHLGRAADRVRLFAHESHSVPHIEVNWHGNTENFWALSPDEAYKIAMGLMEAADRVRKGGSGGVSGA